MLSITFQEKTENMPLLRQKRCPYDCSVTGICSASLSGMTISSGSRSLYCSTDDYDDCPVFLSRLIRRR